MQTKAEQILKDVSNKHEHRMADSLINNELAMCLDAINAALNLHNIDKIEKMDNIDITFLTFAWNSLTEQQQFRINMRYELKRQLDSLPKGKTKRSCYRVIAEQFKGYSVSTIEYIANHELIINYG